MKKRFIKLFVFLVIFSLTLFTLSSCKEKTGADNSASSNISNNEKVPATAKELVEFTMNKVLSKDTKLIYPYASDQLKALMDEDTFSKQFLTKEDLLSYSIDNGKEEQGYTSFDVKADFKNSTATYTLSVKNLKIEGFFFSDIKYKNDFSINIENNITENYFNYKENFNNSDIDINACYTKINDGQKHPLIILLPGSGVIDLDCYIGILKPFEDISLQLAKKGINTLRMDKIAVNSSDKFDTKDGVEKEYQNFYSSIAYAKTLPDVSEIYLLGHSLGGVVAADIAKSSPDIKGLIILNSTARNIGDILYDQLKNIYPTKESEYKTLRDKIINANSSNCTGETLYSASDYYYASLNKIDTIENIKKANIKTLIINSGNDNQCFDADVNLWKTSFANSSFVSLKTLEKSSNIVYEIDILPTNQTNLYKNATLPQEFISIIDEFIK